MKENIVYVVMGFDELNQISGTLIIVTDNYNEALGLKNKEYDAFDSVEIWEGIFGKSMYQ